MPIIRGSPGARERTSRDLADGLWTTQRADAPQPTCSTRTRLPALSRCPQPRLSSPRSLADLIDGSDSDRRTSQWPSVSAGVTRGLGADHDDLTRPRVAACPADQR